MPNTLNPEPWTLPRRRNGTG